MARTPQQQVDDFIKANDVHLVEAGAAVEARPDKPSRGVRYKLTNGKWYYLGQVASHLLPEGYPRWGNGYSAEPVPVLAVTQDAYMAACRALHWRTAQLRAHGIEPDTMAPDAPHYPPNDHVFDSVRDRTGGEVALAVAEDAFRAGFEAGSAADATRHWHDAWSAYEPSETVKDLV